REKQQAQKLAEAAGLEKNKHTSIDSLATALRAEHCSYGVPDDSSNAAVGNRLMASIGEGVSVVVEAPRPPRRQLYKLLKEYEEKLRKLEKEAGHASRQEILEGSVVVSSSGNAFLDMLLGSYYKAIEDIEKQSQALTEIQRAFFEIQSLYKSTLELAKKSVKEIAGPKGKKITEEVLVIEDDALGTVLALMETSNDLVSKYKKVKFEGIVKRMKSAASPEKRVTVLQSVFDDLYITPISDELMRLSNTEHLQQSLKFTTVFEQQVTALKALGIYPEQNFVQITGVLSKATTKFLNDIKENDKQTYEEYLPLLEEEAKLLSAVEDLSQMPMTLALFQEPMAFFLLSRPSQNLKVIPFTYIERVEREIVYLTEKQKKAFFAYLYFISFNFQEVSQKFLKNTLLSATPITPKDIADLIEIVKQDMKAGGQLKLFQPSPSDQGSLGKFSLRVRSLISGEAREKAIVEKFNTEQQYLRNMLNGITPEKIEAYKRANKLAAKQKDAIIQIQALWDLIMMPDLPKCDIEKLLDFKNELLQLRNTLDENAELLTKLAVFKNVEGLGGAALMVSEGDGEEGSDESMGPSDSSSAVLAIMEKAITPPRVLHGLSAGLLAGISSGLNKQLAAKNSAATSDVPLPPSAPLLDLSAADIDSSLSGAPSFVPPPPSFGPPSAPELNLEEPVAPRIKVLSPAEQKAAATLAIQLQKISNLETALQLKAGSITTEVYEDITQKIKEAKDDIAAGGMRAAMSERKIKLLDKELEELEKL
ncbi:MAG: hypothetical protein NT128_03005, partial [Proteobacteria bacterium]|nr:hypothetical protein [Pseudomonadota bacterium]